MKMDKVIQKLKDKNVPVEIIKFVELCLKEKESVEVEKEGKMVVDLNKSRISWEDIYLHPLFEGKFKHIVREVAGQDILLTLKTNADS